MTPDGRCSWTQQLPYQNIVEVDGTSPCAACTKAKETETARYQAHMALPPQERVRTSWLSWSQLRMKILAGKSTHGRTVVVMR